MRKNKAFTLVEIMVVIAIIAIISFGAVTVTQGVFEKQRVSKTQTIMKTLNAALKEYQLDTGDFPGGNTNGSITGLYGILDSNVNARIKLAGLPGDCVIPFNGMAGNSVAIYDGWYASDDHSITPDLNDNLGGGGSGENEPMLYIYRKNGNFPVIRSAGKDRIFNTADDIVSSEL